MKKRLIIPVKVLSVLLVILMLVEVMPMASFAQAIDSTISSDNQLLTNEPVDLKDTGENTTTEEEPEATILCEDVSKREEYSKQFKMSDGTYQAAQYSMPIHYLDESGNWTEYDNALQEIDDGEIDDSALARTFSLDSKDYTNASSDSKVKLSKKTNGNKFVSIEKDGYKLSWSYDGAKKQTGKITNQEDDGDPTTLENLVSEVTYNNVFTKTDFQYLVGTNNIKENIILKSKSAQNEFTAQYKCPGLTAISVDSKTIEFRTSDDTTVFILNAPVMFDNNNECSDSITISILSQSNGKVSIKIVADKEWLSNEAREYPVTIDPYIQTKQNMNSMESAYIASSTPAATYGRGGNNYEGSLYVGKETNRGSVRALIKYPTLPTLDACDTIVDAKINLYLRACNSNIVVDAYRIRNSWSQSLVCWNNQPGITDGNRSDYLQIQSATNGGWKTWEITDLVKGWYEGTYENDGIMLISDAENGSSIKRAWFYASGYPDSAIPRPVMILTYRNMSGCEDYWSFTSMNSGRYGATSINNYNGNVVATEPLTLDAGGNLMPVNISLIYNSNKNYVNDFTKVGTGWQTNYHMFIRQNPNWVNDSNNAAYNYKYYFNDADGTQHYFRFENYTSVNGGITGKDEDGLGYTLFIKDVPDPDSTQYIITTKDKTQILFTACANVREIKDANGNSITIYYDADTGSQRLNHITDGAGRTYTFVYPFGDQNLLGGITDPDGRTTIINYNNNSVLKVIYPDSKEDLFYYTSDLKLAQILSCNETYVNINLHNNVMRKASSVETRNFTDGQLLESYQFNYAINETTITDMQNRSYTYQFNDWGQTTGVVSDNDGQAQFIEYSSEHSTSDKTNKEKSVSKAISSTVNYITDASRSESYLNNYIVENSADQYTWDVRDITDNGANTPNSLEVIKVRSAGHTFAYQSLGTIDGAGTYTLSANVNTFGDSVSGNGIILGVQMRNISSGALTPIYNIPTTHSTDDWERLSVTFDLPDGYIVSAMFGINDGDIGAVWYDDIQLEKGSSSNNVNLLSNSSFGSGVDRWTVSGTASSVALSSNELPGISKAMKFTSPTATSYSSAQEYLGISGSKGDVYSFGMWSAAASAPTNNNTKTGTAYSPAYNMKMIFYRADNSVVNEKTVEFNPDVNSWQFLSAEAKAEGDYQYMRIFFCYDYNVNYAYFAAPFCYKEQYGETYDYDNDGNLVSTVDLAKTQSQFSYNGNQMAKMFNPSGSRYMYANEESTNNLLHALSSDGQEYNFTYDNKGNVTSSQIKALKPATTIESGKSYYIVNAYSGNAIDSGINNAGGGIVTHIYKPTTAYYPYQHWSAHSYGGETFSFIPISYTTYAMEIYGANTSDGYGASTYEFNQSAAQKFKAVSNGDGTFRLMTGATNYTKCLDGQYDEPNKVVNCQPVKQNTYDEKKEGQKWYFYPVEYTDSKEISTTATYTEDKNFVASMSDQRGKFTEYNYDQNKGLLNSTTDALGRATTYTYNADNNNLLSVSSGGMTNSYTYSNDKLDTINVNNSVKYHFNYDKFGRTTETKVGNGTTYNTLSTLSYNGNNLLSKQTYGNDDFIDFNYDNLDRIIEKKYNNNDNKKVTFQYGNNGSLASSTDYFTGLTTKYTYDLADRVVAQKEFDSNNALVSSVKYTFADKTNYLTGVKHFSPLGTQTIGYRYGNLASGEMPDAVYGVNWNGSEKVNYTYDSFGRLASTNFVNSGTNPFSATTTTTYNYLDVADSNKTTTLVSSMSTMGVVHNYTYDAVGNITSIYDGSKTLSYEYDSLNQLVRSNNGYENKTHTYEYENGNITYDHIYAYTTDTLPTQPLRSVKYNYDDPIWKDKLTSISEISYTNDRSASASAYSLSSAENSNCAIATQLLGNDYHTVDFSSQSLFNTDNSASLFSADSTRSEVVDETNNLGYDEIGNLTSYMGASFSWQGRQLQGFSTEDVSVSYQYNSEGQRTKKIIAATDGSASYVYDFYYNGSILAGQTLTITEGEDVTTQTLTFMYDQNGEPFGFTYNGEEYFYIRNAQNDIYLISDSRGYAQVYYQYDAWGKIIGCYDATSDGIGSLNPFMYRGYYYEVETGFYSLQSRYYDPEIGRFINADDSEILFEDQDNILQYNLFAYCFNNPVNMHDPDGYAAANIIGGIIGGVAGAALGYLLAKQLGLTGWKKWALISAATIGGAALGAFLGPYVAKLAKSIGSTIKTVAKQAFKYRKFTENANKIHHFFGKSQHNFGSLLRQFNGNERKAFNAIYNATFNQVKKQGITGTFETVVRVCGQNVTVRGTVIKGVIRIGTGFIG